MSKTVRAVVWSVMAAVMSVAWSGWLFGASAQTAQTAGTFTDSRDGKTYKTVKIGKQTWMAENLNYQTDSASWKMKDSSSYSDKYGMLYTWNDAGKVCPDGWSLPTCMEWDALAKAVGGKNVAGTKLKAKSGWAKNGGGTDVYGFSALPGGYRKSYDSEFIGVGNDGYWWTSCTGSEKSVDENGESSWESKVYYKAMNSNSKAVREGGADEWMGHSAYYSVRCVQDVKK
jgi:uncharacterized protein (TIGR02145 family)